MAITNQPKIILTTKSKMRTSRKGFFLTMVALLLVALFVLYFQISVLRQSQPASVANAARVNSISAFVEDLETFYLPNLVAVSLRSSLVGVTNFLAGGNRYVAATNHSQMFYQLITNGTMHPFNTTVFSNETLNKLLGEFTNLTDSQLNIPLQINYTPYQFSIAQSSPWTVTATMVFLYTINTTDVSLINRTLQVSATVPITGLREPSFLINTRGTYAPNITQTNTSTWTIARLKTHIQRQEFAANPQAPSYLDRLTNTTTASPYGIEFFVNTTQFGFGVTPANYSFVDHQFWTRPWNCTPISQNLYNITGISNEPGFRNFLVDDNRASKYLNQTERLINATIVCYQ